MSTMGAQGLGGFSGVMNSIFDGIGSMFTTGGQTGQNLYSNPAKDGTHYTSPTKLEGMVNTQVMSNGVPTADAGKLYSGEEISGFQDKYGAKEGKFDFGSTMDSVSKMGNMYSALQTQKMRQKEFDSNEAFKKWMKDKEDKRSKAAQGALMSISN